MRPVIGQSVTSIVTREAFYSGYAGLPDCSFEPGDVGVVGAVDVAAVHAPIVWVGNKKTYPHGHNPVYACVDFEKYGQIWRVNLYYSEIRDAE